MDRPHDSLLQPPFYLALASDATCSAAARDGGGRAPRRSRKGSEGALDRRWRLWLVAPAPPTAASPAPRARDISASRWRRSGVGWEAAAAGKRARRSDDCGELWRRALAADARRRAPWRAEAGTRQVTLVPSGPWVEGVFWRVARRLRYAGDAPLGDLLGGVDEAARLRSSTRRGAR